MSVQSQKLAYPQRDTWARQGLIVPTNIGAARGKHRRHGAESGLSTLRASGMAWRRRALLISTPGWLRYQPLVLLRGSGTYSSLYPSMVQA